MCLYTERKSHKGVVREIVLEKIPDREYLGKYDLTYLDCITYRKLEGTPRI